MPTSTSDSPDSGHRPVLLDAALRALNVEDRRGGLFVDATFGRGGHSGALLDRLDQGGRLLAFDRDPEAAAAAASGRFAADPRFTFEQANFAELNGLLTRRGLAGQIDGVLLDLGVSSPQLDDPARGFSFRHDGPLDMRMDPDGGASAADWLAAVEEKELVQVLRRYGEERFAGRIAKALVAARAERALTRTGELAELVSAAVPRARWEPGKHPATRSFQAIRIVVNNELGALQEALPALPALLAGGGRLAVISFHSLEDRIVKQFIQREARGAALPDRLPLTAAEADAAAGMTLRSLFRQRPDEAELAVNARARSATLRAAERLS